MAPAPLGGLDDSEFAGEARSYWSRAFGRFLQHRFAVASLILLVLIFAAGLLASRLAPYGYQEANLHALNSGRDYLSRTLYGIGTSAQVALLVGVIACLIERKQAWFLCSRSRDGRHWAPPVRVSRQPDNAFVLWADAIRAGFGDDIAYGSYPGLAAAAGVAHPMWIDARDRSHLDQEIFTARLPSASLSAPPR